MKFKSYVSLRDGKLHRSCYIDEEEVGEKEYYEKLIGQKPEIFGNVDDELEALGYGKDHDKECNCGNQCSNDCSCEDSQHKELKADLISDNENRYNIFNITTKLKSMPIDTEATMIMGNKKYIVKLNQHNNLVYKTNSDWLPAWFRVTSHFSDYQFAHATFIVEEKKEEWIDSTPEEIAKLFANNKISEARVFYPEFDINDGYVNGEYFGDITDLLMVDDCKVMSEEVVWQYLKED